MNMQPIQEQGKLAFHCFPVTKNIIKRSTVFINGALFGNMLGNLINDGQTSKDTHYEALLRDYLATTRNFHALYPDLNFRPVSVHTKDNGRLESIEISPAAKNPDPQKLLENKVTILVFMGNREYLQGKLKHFCYMSQTLNCNIVSFNYRGKGNSTGKVRKIRDFIDDGKAQVEALLAQGVKPEHLLLYGNCFGGALATEIAKDLHQEGKKAYLFNDRSFSSLSQMIGGMIKTSFIKNKFHEHSAYNRVQKFRARFLSPCVKYLVKSTDWELDAAAAYKTIPEGYKDYLVIKSSKAEKRARAMFDDGLVVKEASLHSALKPERAERKKQLKSALERLRLDRLNGFASSPEESLRRRDKEADLRKELASYSNRIMRGTANDHLEDYFDLSKKQTLIRLCKKLKRALPLLMDILVEVECVDANREVLRSPADYRRNGLRTKEELKNAVLKIMGEMTNKEDLLEGGQKQITDLKSFTDELIQHYIQIFWKSVRKIKQDPSLQKRDLFSISFEQEGLLKIGHNRLLKDLVSRNGQMTGEDYLKQFVEKMLPS